MVTLHNSDRFITLEIGADPDTPLQFIFGHCDILIFIDQLRHLLHRCDIFADHDCLLKLLVEFGLIQLFEVIVVKDLDHLATEASPPGG